MYGDSRENLFKILAAVVIWNSCFIVLGLCSINTQHLFLYTWCIMHVTRHTYSLLPRLSFFVYWFIRPKLLTFNISASYTQWLYTVVHPTTIHTWYIMYMTHDTSTLLPLMCAPRAWGAYNVAVHCGAYYYNTHMTHGTSSLLPRMCSWQERRAPTMWRCLQIWPKYMYSYSAYYEYI